MNFEDNLRKHLHNQGDAHELPGLKGLADINDAAQRRSKRHQVAGGFFAVAALTTATLFGVQAMSGGDTRSVATVDATQATATPVPAATDTTDTAGSDAQLADEGDAPLKTDSTPQPAPAPQTIVTGPAPSQIFHTGSEFVGFAAQTSAMSSELDLIRSIDGVTWDRIPTTGLDAAAFPVQSVVHGTQMASAIIDVPDVNSAVGDAPSVSLAYSPDLENWTVQALPAGESSDLITISNWIQDMVINNAGVLVFAFESKTPNFDALGLDPSNICGWTHVGDQFTVNLCDGSTTVVSTENEPTMNSATGMVDESVFYFTADGTTLEAPTGLPNSLDLELIATDNEFIVIDGMTNTRYRSTDGRTFNAELTTASAFPNDHSPTATASRGSEIVMATQFGPEVPQVHFSPDGGTSWTSTSMDGFAAIGPDETFNVMAIADGPGGFALLASVYPSAAAPDVQPILIDGFTVTSIGGGPEITVTADDGSFNHTYTRSGPIMTQDSNMQSGLLGGIRFFDPVSGELVVEVPNSVEQQVYFGPDSGVPNGGEFALDIDGYTLSGGMFADSFLLTSPDGLVREFSQFAMTNGVTTDGAEISSLETEPYLSDVVFYDEAGTELITVSMDRLFNVSTSSIIYQDESSEFTPDSQPFSVTRDGITLEGDFPVGELRLVDENGTVVQTWFAGEDFEPSQEPNVEMDNLGTLTFTDPDSDTAITLTIEDIMLSLPESELRDMMEGGVPIGEDANMRSIIMFSPDGVTWTVLEDTASNIFGIAVGEDSVVVIDTTMAGPEPRVIPIP